MLINGSASTAFNVLAANSESRIEQKNLGQEDFLKLLVTQMTNQDPLDPKGDMAFIAEMAQFSALEQSRTMQADISKLRDDQRMLHANALLGRTVAIQKGEDEMITGMVDVVRVRAGTPKIEVNGEEFGLDQLVTISPAQLV